MKTSILLTLIGLLFGLVGSLVLLFAVEYKQISNVSFNVLEVNGKVVSEDRATSTLIHKSYYYLGISCLLIGFLLQGIAVLINK